MDDAIAAWSQVAQQDPSAAAALAEALFRRATRAEAPATGLADLQRSVKLAPQDLRYRYHLGLANHRTGNLSTAVDCYRAVLARDPSWSGAGYVLALATLEQNPTANLAALPGATPIVARLLAPAQALLLGHAAPSLGDTPPERLWQGIAALQGDAHDAREALADEQSMVHAAAGIRAYYHGVAAAADGDIAAALTAWQAAQQAGFAGSWLSTNLAAALVRRLLALAEAGDLAGAVPIAQMAQPLAGEHNALASVAVAVLDKAAQASAAAGDWPRAATLWETARSAVGGAPALGSPRSLWHNLALAYEAQEHWLEAADTWRGLLRTRPRGRAVAGDEQDIAVERADPGGGQTEAGGLSEAHWLWVRQRVIECYKRARQPGAAVDMYRQAIKADPHDVNLRIEFASALLANEQEQAAEHELHRVLERDRSNVDARLRLAELESEREHWPAAATWLRAVLKGHPERDDARRQLAQVLKEEGDEWHDLGKLKEAGNCYAEGQQLAPDDPNFSLCLARVAIDGRQRQAAAALLARALEIGADRPEVYITAMECWGVLGDLDEARRILARAEAALPLTSEFFVEAARVLLTDRRVGAPVLGALPPPGPPTASRWVAFAQELLDRAVHLSPDDPGVFIEIATALLAARPDLALRYAQEAARLDAEEPRTLQLLAVTQAANRQRREAKETMRRAARLARQQGDGELGHEIEDLASMVDSPLFDLMLKSIFAGGLEALDELFSSL